MSEKQLYVRDDFKRRLPPRRRRAEEWRTAFRRDYARLLHSPAFRRLQGKTQLFPGTESDYFRNRLTHSLEVAQVAKSIAMLTNHSNPYFERHPIDTDLVEFAALAHDLGHPPFGHNGEEALDARMKQAGGFEGNAQTLRIISRLEKKIAGEGADEAGLSATGNDLRLGLNPTLRTLASVIKYDAVIPAKRKADARVHKGFYEDDKACVDAVREAVLRGADARLSTIECQIMDIADDIAYSTYDLEDALKAGFVTLVSIFAAGDEIHNNVALRMSEALGRAYSASDVIEIFTRLFHDFFSTGEFRSGIDIGKPEGVVDIIRVIETQSQSLSDNGYLRTEFTSAMIAKFIDGIDVEVDPDNPMLSRLKVDLRIREEIEALKHFNYLSVIDSPRLSLVRFRGKQIVTEIFDALEADASLLPQDFRVALERQDKRGKKRIICDFIAGMTDRYAVEFYARLTSENPQTIFKPH